MATSKQEALRQKLEDLHDKTIQAITDALDGQEDEDGNVKRPDNDTLRVALQLLKQNQISAAAMPESPHAALAAMAGKLEFSAIQRKLEARVTFAASSADPVAAARLPQAAPELPEAAAPEPASR